MTSASARGGWFGWYALATAGPAAALGLACVLGGLWCLAALLALILPGLAIDLIGGVRIRARTDAAAIRQGRCLTCLLGTAHFLILALGVQALVQGTPGAVAETAALAVALGMYLGQVSNATAHELIHAPTRPLRRFGAAILSSLLFGHHASAHRKVHHRFVATARDPNSARAGEGFPAFWLRAWAGSFIAGWRAEAVAGRGLLRHPYAGYAAGSVATLAAAGMIGGLVGVIVLVLLALAAQTQLLLSDYVQHYGLRRDIGPDGRLAPVGPAHAWNARPWFSGAMLLNAPRHSDHHANPGRAFPSLRLSRRAAPMLPAALPAMAMLALVPPLWRRVMDPRLAAVTGASVNQPVTKSRHARRVLPDCAHVARFDDSDAAGRPALRTAGHDGR